MHANFAAFSIFQRQKYQVGLCHSEKACELEPNFSHGHYMKAESLYKLNKFELSLKEYLKCLKLNEIDKILGPNHVEYTKIRLLF